MVFKKTTKLEKERLKARRAESRARIVERVTGEATLACYCYVGSADKQLSQAELEVLVELFPAALGFVSPTRDALARKVRAYITGAAPTRTERRRLRSNLVHFAACDGPFNADEQAAVRDIEDFLGISPQTQSAKHSSWGRSRSTVGAKNARTTSKAHARTRAKVQVVKPPRPWCYDYLGCSESDSDDVIKRCYRQLAVKLHPDKHVSRAKSAEDIASHVQAFQKLQAAYAEIWHLRGKPSMKG